MDDLIQVGLIGLSDALSRYEAGQGAQFETFATQRIRGAMLDELLRIGAVSQEAQQVVLNTAAYVPGGNLADKLAIMGRDGADFIDTIDHKSARSNRYL